MNDSATKFKMGNQLLDRQIAWIASADNKIPPVFAIAAAMLGVLCALAPSLSGWSIGPAIWSTIAALLLVASIVFLVIAAWPRLSGPQGSVVFFGGISNKSEEQVVKQLNFGITPELIDDIFRQIHRNAEIASVKYSNIRYSMWCLFGSLVPWLVAIWLLYPGYTVT